MYVYTVQACNTAIITGKKNVKKYEKEIMARSTINKVLRKKNVLS